jgi:hypothetical protein
MPSLRFFPRVPDLLPARDELLDFPPLRRPSTPATSPDLPPHPPTRSTATTSPTSLPASSFADPTSRGPAKRPAPQTSPPPPRASTGSLPARERGRLQRLARPRTPTSLHICRGEAAHRTWGAMWGVPLERFREDCARYVGGGGRFRCPVGGSLKGKAVIAGTRVKRISVGLRRSRKSRGPGTAGANRRLFYFLYFLKMFFTEIYFRFHILQFYISTVRHLPPGRGRQGPIYK